MTPILNLVAPAGMHGDERKTWLRAAYLALADVPLDMLESGTTIAMRTVDHPAKIVSSIRHAIAGRMAVRASAARMPEVTRLPQPAPVALIENPITMDEVRGWLPDYRRIALDSGFITQAMFDQTSNRSEADDDER